jgi:hypothetical protein
MNSSQRVVKIRISPGTVEDSAAILHTIANLFQTDDLEISILDKESLLEGAGVHIAGHDMSVVVNVSNQGFSEKAENFEILPSQSSFDSEMSSGRTAFETLQATSKEIIKDLAKKQVFLKSLDFLDASNNIFSQAEENLHRQKKNSPKI